MKWGNISNQVAPIIAVNIDNTLFNPKEDSIINTAKRFFRFDTKHYDYFSRTLNRNGADILNNLWKNNDISLYLITFTDYSDEIEELLNAEDILFTRLQKAQGVDWLRRKCMYGYSYYFDSDAELLSKLSVDNARNISEITKYLRV